MLNRYVLCETDNIIYVSNWIVHESEVSLFHFTQRNASGLYENSPTSRSGRLGDMSSWHHPDETRLYYSVFIHDEAVASRNALRKIAGEEIWLVIIFLSQVD